MSAADIGDCLTQFKLISLLLKGNKGCSNKGYLSQKKKKKFLKLTFMILSQHMLW